MANLDPKPAGKFGSLLPCGCCVCPEHNIPHSQTPPDAADEKVNEFLNHLPSPWHVGEMTADPVYGRTEIQSARALIEVSPDLLAAAATALRRISNYLKSCSDPTPNSAMDRVERLALQMDFEESRAEILFVLAKLGIE